MQCLDGVQNALRRITPRGGGITTLSKESSFLSLSVRSLSETETPWNEGPSYLLKGDEDAELQQTPPTGQGRQNANASQNIGGTKILREVNIISVKKKKGDEENLLGRGWETCEAGKVPHASYDLV